MSDREEFEKQFPMPYGVFWDVELSQYEASQMEFGPDADEYHRMWQVWQAARANGTTVPMTRIAESKIRQMGGDVCGVLVRKDGKLAAVDEHGRVQWLQDDSGDEYTAYLEAMNSHLKAELEAARAQSVQGAEPVAYMFADECGRTKIVLGKETAEHWCPPDETVTPLYTHPQPQSAESISYPDCDTCGGPMDYMPWHYATETDRHLHACNECWAGLTFGQPAGDGWVRCVERLPNFNWVVLGAYESDADGEPCLDVGAVALQPDGSWIGLGTFYRPNKEAGTIYQNDFSKRNVVMWMDMPQPPKSKEGK